MINEKTKFKGMLRKEDIDIGDIVHIKTHDACGAGFVYDLYPNSGSIYLTSRDPLRPISDGVFDRHYGNTSYSLANIVFWEMLKKRSESEREVGLELRNRLEEFRITNKGSVDFLNIHNNLGDYFKPKYGKVTDANGRNVVLVYGINHRSESKEVIAVLRRKELLRKLRKSDRVVMSITGILSRHFNLDSFKSESELKQEIQRTAYTDSHLQTADSYLITKRTPGDNFNSFIGQATGIYFESKPPKAIVEYFRSLKLNE